MYFILFFLSFKYWKGSTILVLFLKQDNENSEYKTLLFEHTVCRKQSVS